MVGIVNNIFNGEATIATKEMVRELTESKWVKDLFEQIRQGDADKKKLLPALMPNGVSTDGQRKNTSCIETNNVYLDFDDHEGCDRLWEKVKDHLDEWKIRLFKESPRKGAHMIVPRIKGKNIKETIQIWSDYLGEDFDNVHDLARLMFISPKECIRWESDELYEETQAEDFPFTGMVPVNRPEKSKKEQTDKKEPVAEEPLEEDKVEITVNYSTTFKGIPYSQIIDRLLMYLGVDSSPVEGERNNTLYMLARELRYICDFNAKMIQSVVPDWGLSDSEVASTIKSALATPRKFDIPEHLKTILNQLNNTYTDEYDISEHPWEKIPEHLPKVVDFLLSKYPDNFKAPVLATLPVLLGTLATNLRAQYLDGSEQSPTFFVCVVAP